MSKALIVLPTYNEVENIQSVYDRIRKVTDSDILFIDDGSDDGTRDMISKLKTTDSGIFEILRQDKLGLGRAYRVAYKYAVDKKYDVLIQCDADGSHQIEKIPEMLAKIDSGTDLVIGSRYVPGGSVSGWAKTRLYISKTGNAYAKLTLGLRTNDNTAGFRAYRMISLSNIEYWKATANGYAFQVQMTYLFRNLKIVEIPINFTERQFGKSKMTLGIALEAIIQIPLLRFK